MAFIRRIKVEELATRRINLERALNRDVNVFFGVNGSGKTSLLRIIQGALSGSSSTIKTVPFSSAEVDLGDIYVFNPTRPDFEGDLIRQTVSEIPEPGQLTLTQDHVTMYKSNRATRKLWYTDEPKIEEQDFSIRHIYLPISRLYISDRRLPRASREATSLASEESLEKLFSDVVNFLWLRYTRNTSLEIQEAQSDGLRAILADFLSPDPHIDEHVDLNVQEAYRRLQSFLSRYESFVSIPEGAFQERLNSDDRMRRVLKYIDEVETQVEILKKPRNEFASLLRRMIASEKTVELGGRDIHAFANEEEISLGRLSSGEKQLIRICIEALLADGAPILIDEPELSMHIDWQRQLIPAITALAPHSQLIIATHSPEIMAPLADHQIFEL